MYRALQLAGLGIGSVSPNPLVGCVIVHNNQVIGEGWHRKYGEAHAEVNAINAVGDQSLLSESTVYVTLEPCTHFGKTPPCADLLIEKNVKNVVIATTDPNPKVSGKGIKKLQDHGIIVTSGVLEKEAVALNKRFFTSLHHQRPYIILKWAETKDRFIARKDFSSRWISGSYSRQLVHKWRSEEDAIIVGSNTAVHDNPALNVREWSGADPLRVVIDRHLKLPRDLKIFSDGNNTICYNLLKSQKIGKVDFIKVDEDHFLKNLMSDLHKKGLQSIFVEGGAALISAFVREGLWDEARVFVSRKTFGEGIPAPVVKGNLLSCNFVDEDELLIFSNKDNQWLNR